MLVPPLDRTLAASGVSRSCKGNARPKLVPVSTLLPGEQFLGHGVMRPWSIHKFLPHLPRHNRTFPNPPCLNMPYLTCLTQPVPHLAMKDLNGPCRASPAVPYQTAPKLAVPYRIVHYRVLPNPTCLSMTRRAVTRQPPTQHAAQCRNTPNLPHLSSPPVPGQTCPN